MSRLSMYNRTVDVLRTERVDDGAGGAAAPIWQPVHKAIRCRFEVLTTKEMTFTYDKQVVFANNFVYIEYIPDLHEGDRIEDAMDGRVYEVKLVMNVDRARKYMKIACMEIR